MLQGTYALPPGPAHRSGHTDTIASLALSRSGTHLLSTSLDDTTRIWDVRPFAPEPQPGNPSDPRLYSTLTGTMSGFENLLIKGAWSADGERVASGSADRTCTIWEYVLLHHSAPETDRAALKRALFCTR